jgi:hypothetical protein
VPSLGGTARHARTAGSVTRELKALAQIATPVYGSRSSTDRQMSHLSVLWMPRLAAKPAGRLARGRGLRCRVSQRTLISNAPRILLIDHAPFPRETYLVSGTTALRTVPLERDQHTPKVDHEGPGSTSVPGGVSQIDRARFSRVLTSPSRDSNPSPSEKRPCCGISRGGEALPLTVSFA